VHPLLTANIQPILPPILAEGDPKTPYKRPSMRRLLIRFYSHFKNKDVRCRDADREGDYRHVRTVNSLGSMNRTKPTKTRIPEI
jgi:hypothetical protein